jgi:hypothetical protein
MWTAPFRGGVAPLLRAIRIQRLEGSRFIRGAELWALNGLKLGSDVSRPGRLVCRELLDWELMGTDELGDMASLCCEAKTVAARMT